MVIAQENEIHELFKELNMAFTYVSLLLTRIMMIITELIFTPYPELISLGLFHSLPSNTV